MNRINMPEKKDYVSSVMNFLIFSSFICGLMLKFKGCSVDTGSYSDLNSELMVYTLILNLAFIAASSVLGLILLPMLSLWFGGISYDAAGLRILSYTSSSNPDVFFLAASAIFFPIFFTAAAEGMETSIILINSLSGQSTAVRHEYNKKYILIICGAALWAFAVYTIGKFKN